MRQTPTDLGEEARKLNIHLVTEVRERKRDSYLVTEVKRRGNSTNT